MKSAFHIRITAIAAVSVVAVASTATAERLPRPLGVGHQQLSVGVHVLDLVSREQPGAGGPKHLPRIAITLPSGWLNYDGWGMNDTGGLSVSFWDVDKVYASPCQSTATVDPGPTVAGLASALAAQPLRHASVPRGIALAGFHGVYLAWSVPRTGAGCSQGYFESWTATGWASDRYQQGPGQVDRLWILDLKGQRLVIDASYMPWSTGKERAELGRIVHSIRFLAVSSRKTASARDATAARLVRVVTVSDINDRGQIVGGLRTGGGASRGFVWDRGTLRLLGRGPFESADRINERGEILGTSSSPANSEQHAVLWEHGRMRDLGFEFDTAINARGQILGGRFVKDGDTDTPRRPCSGRTARSGTSPSAARSTIGDRSSGPRQPAGRRSGRKETSPTSGRGHRSPSTIAGPSSES